MRHRRKARVWAASRCLVYELDFKQPKSAGRGGGVGVQICTLCNIELADSIRHTTVIGYARARNVEAADGDHCSCGPKLDSPTIDVALDHER